MSSGDWCRYCPSWGACPAKRQLVQRIGVELDEWQAIQPLTPAQAGAAWVRLKEFQSALRRVESAVLAARAQYGELPLPSGMILREVVEPGNERLDGRVVFAVIRDSISQVVAEAAVEIDASKASIDRALKNATCDGGPVKPRTVAKWSREILAEVRARGGTERPIRKKLVEFDPRAPVVEDASPASLPAHAATEEKP